MNHQSTWGRMGHCGWSILLIIASISTWASIVWSYSSSEHEVEASKVRQHGRTPIDFVEIAKKVTPFVVNVSAKRTIEHPSIEDAPFFKGPFEKFFRRFREEEKFEAKGLGSGVIVRSDGYILTNNHVVEKAEEIVVSILDNHIFKAEVIGRDPTTDIAVIKIDGEGLPEAILGDSDESEVGEWVLAVGNPMRLPFTVTAGIISAKGRNIDIIPGSYSIESFIQTDAAINPGNSGGPLINLSGEVIGINTAISTNTGYYQGYGFAIPINLAKRVLEDIIEKGRVVRAILGVSIRNLTPELAEKLLMKETTGVRIEGFVPEDSPALEAGLRQGDIIIELDGEKVTRVNELQSLVAQHDPGDSVTLCIIRDGEKLYYTVMLTEKPDEGVLLARDAEETRNNPLGVSLKDIDDHVRKAHNLDQEIGVMVEEITPDGPGSVAKPYPLLEGDLILEIAKGINIASVKDMKEKLSDLRDQEELLLYISRYSGGVANKYYTVIKPRW